MSKRCDKCGQFVSREYWKSTRHLWDDDDSNCLCTECWDNRYLNGWNNHKEWGE